MCQPNYTRIVSQSANGTQNQLQTDGTFNYLYDGEGNTTRRTTIATGAVVEYTWDFRNRMTSVTEKTSATGTVTKRVATMAVHTTEEVG